uniref:Uncharacterized protein n=1 Tax=Drosophila-associated filamentous virus TaxID=2743186 RepID=A0A6M9U080_9VIRU|nr:putative protein 22 [Drosophila-associated filamentous virus]
MVVTATMEECSSIDQNGFIEFSHQHVYVKFCIRGLTITNKRYQDLYENAVYCSFFEYIPEGKVLKISFLMDSLKDIFKEDDIFTEFQDVLIYNINKYILNTFYFDLSNFVDITVQDNHIDITLNDRANDDILVFLQILSHMSVYIIEYKHLFKEPEDSNVDEGEAEKTTVMNNKPELPPLDQKYEQIKEIKPETMSVKTSRIFNDVNDVEMPDYTQDPQPQPPQPPKEAMSVKTSSIFDDINIDMESITSSNERYLLNE